MNPPEIKNVTPSGPPAVPAPGGPVAAAGGVGALAQGARPPAIGMRQIVAIVVLLAVLLFAYKLLHHHRNSYEATADAVTLAIEKNDMGPVEHAFNAIRRPQLEDRARVGRLSNMLVPLGAFKGSKEITPQGSAAGLHEFTETFANGSKFEKFELDADGKISEFYIGDPPSTSTTP